MNALWQRAQELQKAIELERLRGRGGCLPWLYFTLGRVRERLASERLANHNSQGWIDRLAAITAYARAGASVRAGRLWSASHAQAEGWPDGSTVLTRQHDELKPFLHQQALEPFGISLPGATSSSDVDHVLRLARALWPDGVIDVGDGQAARRLDAALKSRWPVPVDFTLHESMAAYDSTMAVGPTDASDTPMMLVVVESNRVCFIADERVVETHGLAKDMVDALKGNRRLANTAPWLMSAPREAA
jgi:hypothetical protein